MKKDAKSQDKSSKDGAELPEAAEAADPKDKRRKKDKKKAKPAEKARDVAASPAADGAAPGSPAEDDSKVKKKGKKAKKAAPEAESKPKKAKGRKPAAEAPPEPKAKKAKKAKTAKKSASEDAATTDPAPRPVVILVRHADAGQPSATNDIERPLTRKGRKQSRRLRAALAALGVAPAAIVTSPATRARDTAERLRRGGDGKPAESDALWESSAQKVADIVSTHAGPWPLALVGHEPDLGHALAHLACGEGAGAIALGKGGAACLDIEKAGAGGAKLRWILTPALVKQLS